MDSEGGLVFLESVTTIHLFLSALEDFPDPRAENSRHDLGELLVIAFVAVLCGATSCAWMAAFGRAKESVFRGFLKLKHAVPSHDTFLAVFWMIDQKALDAAFRRVLSDVTALLQEGDVIAVDGKALRGARDAGESARTRMMVSAYAARLRLTLASVPSDRGSELNAAIETLGLIALKANQDSLLSDAKACFGTQPDAHPSAIAEDDGHGRAETRKATVVSSEGLAEHHEFPGLKAFGRVEATRMTTNGTTSETRYFALSWMPTPEVLLATVRAHRAIENNLH